MFADQEGNQVTTMDLNNYISQAYRIRYVDNELIISGLSEEALNFTLLKMSLDGEIIFHQEYGGNDADHCFGMDTNLEGEIFLTGHTLSDTENWDTYTMKIANQSNK